ncbi:hypothetical protein BGZ95_001706 [Linnemannia exigua]|uniref:Uncharacterized protein n=1 Tax=Linnemannia exigua TaxID=604196 RepID=A0AAD4H8P4_9FUNG|nr:hypothetical protein BGZ95_001706 [Linnemannia exigua]
MPKVEVDEEGEEEQEDEKVVVGGVDVVLEASGQDAMAAQGVTKPISDQVMPTEPAIQDVTQTGEVSADELVIVPDKEEEKEDAVGLESESVSQLTSEPTLDQEILLESTTGDVGTEAGILGGESESEVGLGEEEVEEVEEEGFQSWIEEPEDEDQDRVRIATGDGDLGSIMDLEDGPEESEEEEEGEEGFEGFDEIKDWSQTASDGEDEEEEGLPGVEERRQRQQRQQQGGYGKGGTQHLQLGILDDDEDDEATEDQDDDFAWRPEFYTLPQNQWYRDGRSPQQQRRVRGGRRLSQQMDIDGAALPLYLPAPERPVDQRSGLRLKKRSMSAEPLLGVTTAAGAPAEAAVIEQGMAIVEGTQAKDHTQEDADSAQLEKRQLAGQYAFQQQQPQQPQQPHHPTPPSKSSPSAIAAAKPQKKANASRPIPWIPLPAECLQYESWTMTDWDLFFNLDPLRHYVRVLTRESMSMAYLESQFNITLPKPEVPTLPQKSSNSTTEAKPAEGKAIGDPESDGDEADKGDSEGNHGGDEGDSDNETDESEKPKPPLLRSEGDVLFFDDTNLYDYRFSENPDSPESQKTRSKFVQEFTIDWLAHRPERLIHLGSIFGTGRVAIESLDAMAWLQMIRDHLIIRTDILQATSQRIADKISGRVEGEDGSSGGGGSGEGKDPMEAGFVGIHIRMSDGHFSLTARDTIENIRQELMWQMGMDDPTSSPVAETGHADNSGEHPHKKQARLSIEQCRARALNHRRALQEQLLQQQHERDRERELGHPPMKPPTPNQQQQQQQPQQPFIQLLTDSPPPKRRSNGRYTPIYLATDAHRPRSNPIFDRLFTTFDCIFTLDDFSEDLEKLTQYRNPEDGTLMTKFLIPMVDAMVVAKAAAFFGTPASTFSNYIQKQLRPAYTGLYD